MARRMEKNNQGDNKQLTLSVIILTWNSERYIEKCLDSVYKNISNIDFEVIVVDNGSKDGTINVIKRYESDKVNFKCILLDKNFGTTYPRNLAIKLSKGKFILFLDSDTEVLDNSVEKLLEMMSDEKVGITAPKIISSDGKVQPSCKKFPTIFIKVLKFLGGKFERFALRLELYDPSIYTLNFSNAIEVDYCISACLLIRRDIIYKVGLFDENIFYAPEDVDLCLRVWLSGFKVIYNANALVLHATQRVSYKNFRILILHIRGLLYYFMKHKYCFSRKRLYERLREISNILFF